MTKQISFPTALSAVIIVGLLIAGYVFGWVTPSQDPPEGDLDAPLDTSDTAQTKSGDLTINGTLTLGSQLISQVASGTAPFSIDSPTLVTNLNADKLDGYDAADLSAGGTPDWYVTSDTYNGENADTACASGYHMCFAGEWLGRQVNTDLNCDGCWDEGAWYDNNSDSGASSCQGDCLNWTSSSDTEYGSYLDAYVYQGEVSGLYVRDATCDNALHVACCSN